MRIRSAYQFAGFRFTMMGRIVSIIGVCILLIVSTSVVSIYKIRTIASELEQIAHIDIPLSKSISILAAHSAEQSTLIERLLRYRLSDAKANSAQITGIKSRLADLSKLIEDETNKSLQITYQAFHDSQGQSISADFALLRSYIQQARARQSDYKQTVQRSLEIALFGNREKAYDLLEKAYKKHSGSDQALSSALLKIQVISERAANEAFMHEQDAVSSAIFLNILAVIFAFALAFWLGRRHVSQPLLEVVQALNGLSDNRFDMKLPKTRTDEIGEIGRSYETLKKRLQTTQEDEIRERQALEKLNREIKLMAELTQWLQSTNSLNELFRLVSDFLAVLVPGCKGEIYLYSNSRDVLDGVCSWNGATAKPHIKPTECWGLRHGRSYSEGNSVVNFKCAHTEDSDAISSVCLPFLAHGETLGLMHLTPVSDLCKEEFQEQSKLAQLAAEQISLAIANTRMRDELHDQSIRDPLTGLFNRRHFLEQFRTHIHRADQRGDNVSLISLDVDHFKRFNDNHGHDAGDMVLRSVASVLEQFFDGDDTPCRIGGEEFVILLPAKGLDEAEQIANRLREAFEELVVRYGEKRLPQITVSGGVSAFPHHGTLPQDILKAADLALYESKGNGRNQITVAKLDDQTHHCSDHSAFLQDADEEQTSRSNLIVALS